MAARLARHVWWITLPRGWWIGHWRYPAAALVVAVVTGSMAPVTLSVLNLLLIYLLVSFVLALLFGAGPAAFGVVLSFLAFDFFFIPPFHTFSVAQPAHVLALVIYLGIATITGQLVGRVRARTELAERERARTALLYELNAALISDVTLDAILATIVEHVVHVYGAAQSRILIPDAGGRLTVRARFPASAPETIDQQRLALAVWAFEQGTPAGRDETARRRARPPHGLGQRPRPLERRGPDVLYLPIATTTRSIGVLEVVGRPGTLSFGSEETTVLTSFANQAALALERARLSEEIVRTAAHVQSDELKSALLAAVSHDLRTPLAAIKASVTSLLDASVTWDDVARAEFLQAINEETDRLTLLVGNLLDLSRIEGGALHPIKAWYDVGELIEDVSGRTAPALTAHPLTTDVAPDVPLACFDYVEIAQVLTNLLENVSKYTPAGTAVAVSARRAGDTIEVCVTDQGPGIAAEQVPHIFDKFYRARHDGRVPGVGIGLTISKGLVEAHGGRMSATSSAGHGTAICFTLPLEAAQARMESRP